MELGPFSSSSRSQPDAKVVSVYSGFAILAFTCYNFFSWSFLSTLDHLLTLSAALQTLAFVLLALKIHTHRSIAGISKNMLYLYGLSFVCRLSSTLWLPGYVPEDGTADFWLYQIIEIIGLCVVLVCTYFTHVEFRDSYEDHYDTFPVVYIVLASVVLALFTHSDANNFWFFDVLWMFSQWIDSLAMAPQLFFISKVGQVERMMSHFIAMTICARVVLGLFWWLLQIAHPIDGAFAYGILASNLLHLLLCGDYMYYFVLTLRDARMVLPKSFHLDV